MPSPQSPNAADSGSPEAPREPVSLKRGREGSIDPLANESFSAAQVPKKNRLERAVEEDVRDAEPERDSDDDSGSRSSQTNEPAAARKEGHTVTEVRRKVQEMNWKEGEARQEQDIAESSAAPSAPASSKGMDEEPSTTTIDETPAAPESVRAMEDQQEQSAEAADKPTTAAEGEDDAADWVKVDKSEAASADAAEDAAVDSDTPSLKRKASETAAVEEKKRKSTSPTPNDTPKPAETATDAPAPAQPPKKPQATFGSFASKPSPFASAGSGAALAGASPFAAAASNSPFGEAASKPNALDAAKPKPANSFASSGFGSYSSAFSPFAKKKADTDEKASASFGDILKEKGDEGEGADEKKPQLDKKDVHTGEEDEETMYQTRAKLYMMEEGGNWKERGVGLLKLNRRRQDSSAARLVMRADGVFRVILNSGLYVGMSCLEDGKHVRMTIFEEGQRRFVTIRTASPKVAAELASAIHEHTPLESKKSKSPLSPGAPDDSAV